MPTSDFHTLPSPRSMSLATMLLASALVAACGPAPEADPGRTQNAIVNGQFDSGHEPVGALTQSQGSLCTATLVGQRTVLTAAHCVEPGFSHTFILDDDRWSVDSVTRHPDYDPDVVGGADVAVVRLRYAPPVQAARIGVLAPELGEQVTLVGLGATSSSGGGSGFKRVAVNTVAKVSATTLTYRFASAGVGNLCFGDSGGPSFATINGQDVQVGVHSFIRGICGQEGNDMRVDVYREWIVQAAGGDVLIGGAVDAQKPEVRITSPRATDEIYADALLEATVTDDQSVALVEFVVDGEVKGSLVYPPYSFKLELSPGAHRLEVRATDAAGNVGAATLDITVAQPKGFGELCASPDQCGSQLCTLDGRIAANFCSQSCSPAGNPCPEGAACEQNAGRYICGPPPALLSSGEGGCRAGTSAAQPGSSLLVSLLLLGLLALGRRRR